MLNKLKALAILAAIILPSITSAGSPQCDNSKRALSDAGVYAKAQYSLQAQTDTFSQLLTQNNNYNLSQNAMTYVVLVFVNAASPGDILLWLNTSHEVECGKAGL